jgi:hypothetical protein
MPTSLISTGVQFPDNSIQTTAAGAAALTFISSTTASSSATVSFTGLATYDQFIIALSDVKLASGNTFRLLFSTDNGATYLSTSYFFSTTGAITNAGNVNNGGASAAQILLNSAQPISATNSISGNVNLFGLPSASVRPMGTSQLCSFDSGNTTISNTAFGHATAQTINAVRFQANTGNIASGTFRLYGVSNS